MVVGENSQPPAKDTTMAFQCQILMSTNYTIWRMSMEVLLGIHRVWDVVDPGSADAKKNNIVKGLLFQLIPEDLEARLQTLITEFENLKLLDNDSIYAYAAKLSGLTIPTGIVTQVEEEDVAHILEVVVEVEVKDVVRATLKTKIKQERNAMKILKEAGMEDCIATLCPMELEVEATEYQTMVGCSHPDLTYSIGMVSRYMQNPRKLHARAIKQILRYLKGTSPIKWCSHTMALSLCEAKFMAATAAACQAIWLTGYWRK
ncbi:pol polyprotein [Tanacetum coccineum]